jgi:hypothetical protein
MTKPSPTEDLILEVLAARHRLGEPWWTFEPTHRRALERLRLRGLVDVVNDTRANLTDTGRTDRLAPGWKPAHVRAWEDLAENLTDSAGMTWWIRQAHTHGIPASAALAMATTAEASIREWGRLLDGADAAPYRAMLATDKTAQEERP